MRYYVDSPTCVHFAKSGGDVPKLGVLGQGSGKTGIGGTRFAF